MTSSTAELLALLPEPKRKAVLIGLTEAQAEELQWDWRFWARPKQLPPEGGWQTWVVLAGRGFGKTRIGAETVRAWACGTTPFSAGPYRRIALVAETAADGRDVMVEGESGLLSVHPKLFRPLYEPSKRRLTWPNGAVATVYNAVEPEQLRGPQHDAAWCDELAKWRYAEETWDQLQFGLRLGTDPRQVVTTTPKPIPVLKRIMAEPGTVVTRGTTYENRSNLAPAFFHRIIRRYEGTRLGRQELQAEVLDDVPGALWTRNMLDRARKDPDGRIITLPPSMRRVVVAVDPSGTSGDDDGDSIGIVVAGLGLDGIGYVLADRTAVLSPAAWGKAVVDAYLQFGADRIVAERNFGGAMVEHVIRTANPNVAYRGVDASRGKAVRAEPIAALYEQDRVKHVGSFADLEDQLVAFTPGGYIGGGSPDRADALVWAFTELMLSSDAAFPDKEDSILCDPFQIPDYWPRISALDLDRAKTAVLWGAIDSSSDVIYLYSEYVSERSDLRIHAGAIRSRGDRILTLFDPEGRQRSKNEAEHLLHNLFALDVGVIRMEYDPEVGIEAVRSRQATRQVLAFRTLESWIAEYRRHRREPGGDLLEEDDHLMRATGMLCLSGPAMATSEGSQDEPEGRDDDRSGRNEITGY